MSDFVKYDLTKILHYHFLNYNPKQQDYLWKVKESLNLFKRILLGWIILDYQGKSHSILYADRFISLREDIQEMIDKLTETFDKKYDRLKWKKKRSLSIRRTLSNLLLCIDMTKLLKEYSFFEWIYALRILIEIKDVERELDNKVPISEYRLCFCYYDAETYQNFIIQYAKLRGCKTATLQHGIMLAPRSGIVANSDFDGHEFLDSVSDYFLMWNEFTKNEAIKAGLPEERIIVLGVVKCVGVKKIYSSSDSSYIGIFLDGELEKQNNIPLITIVQEWAKTHGKKCIFRYHPHFRGDEYNSCLDNNISEVCDRSLSLSAFIERVSFCVVANSTVLFELEYFCIPFLRYACNPILDKYNNYPSIDFTSVESFEVAYTKMINLPPRRFVSADNSYAAFFKQFIS